MVESKADLRKRYVQLRSEQNARLRQDDKQKIFSHLRQVPQFNKAVRVMAYFSKGSEVPTKNLVLELLNDGKRVALPRTDVQGMRITPKYIASLDDLEQSSFGVLEPKSSCPDAKPDELDAILVPAVAYDRRGYRLGYGLGFYDRFLAGYRGLTIGLCYSSQIADALPVEAHDLPVDFIACELELLDTRPERAKKPL